jgi:hypothetical protein
VIFTKPEIYIFFLISYKTRNIKTVQTQSHKTLQLEQKHAHETQPENNKTMLENTQQPYNKEAINNQLVLHQQVSI